MKEIKRNMNLKQKWEKRWKRELELLFSRWGEELQYCLVAQGYEDFLFRRLMVCFGSGFTAAKIIINIKKELEGGN